MNFVRLSIDRPVLVTMGILFFIVMGLFSYAQVPLDMLPRVDIPIITIFTVYPGANPSNIETLISKPIEEAVSTINGIDKLRSSSYEGFSNVIIEFKNDVDVDVAAADVREKVGTVRAELPDDAKEPVIMKLDINALPIISLAVSGPQSVPELYRLIKDFVKDELAKVSGVAEVSTIGGREREIQVLVSQDTLKAHGLSVVNLAGMIAQKSHNIPSGHITQEDREYSIRLDGEFSSIEEIRQTPIMMPNGKSLKLRELAAIHDTYEEFRQAVRLNGKNSVGIIIKKRSDANTVQTSNGILAKLEEIKKKLPLGTKVDVTRNRADFIKDSVNDLNDNLMMGVAITAVILFLFLHSLKATLMAVVSLPVAIIGSYILIYIFGFTINMMTLMALAISVGILVNNAIIVMENVYVHMKRGKDPKTAAEEGTNEIVVAVTGATLTNVVVFVPIAFMSGIIGNFFYEFGMTVAFATFLSLIVAFTMTPMLCAYFLKPTDVQESDDSTFQRLWNKFYSTLEKDYKSALEFCLNRKVFTVGLGIAILVASFPLARYIGFEFVTEPDQGEFDITIKMPAGTSLTRTNEVLAKIEMELQKHPEVFLFYTKLGKTEALVGGSSEGINIGEITVKLKKNAVSTAEFIARLTPVLATIPDVEANVRKTGLMGSTESPIQIYLTGDDLEKLVPLSKQAVKIIEETPGAADVQSSFETGKPEISIIPYREELARFGVSEIYVAMQLRNYFEGSTTSTYRELDDEYDIRIKLDKDIRSDISNITALNIVLPNGKTVPLPQLANIKQTVGPNQIDRFSRSKAIKISANVIGKSMGEVVQEIQKKFSKIELPLGYNFTFSGEVERMDESFRSILIAMLQAVIFTYMLLAALLESFIHPFTILVSFPLAFCGIFLGLFLTGKTLSIFSLMAVVMLVGIVVNNGILLIEQIRLLRAEGKTCMEAVIEGCPMKLRPIIMTALATVCAMIPLALGLGAGGEMRAPMAIISIGGLLASTIMSIFLIPVLYHFVEVKLLRTK